jgi:hypothetical protein
LAQNRRALQTQVATEFHRRFAEIAERMPDELRLAGTDEAMLASLPADRRASVLRSALAYFNLGSEEFALRETGRLGRDVWQVTSRELAANFASPIWREAWQEIRDGYVSHPAFRETIDAMVKKAAG